jgi:hypothetical protein
MVLSFHSAKRLIQNLKDGQEAEAGIAFVAVLPVQCVFTDREDAPVVGS